MTATILFVPATMNAAVKAQARAGLAADWVLGSRGPGIPAAAIARVRSTPGVSAAVSATTSTIWIGRDRRSVEGLSSAGRSAAIDPDVALGSLRGLSGGSIAMSSVAAQGRHIGDQVSVTLGDGARESLTLVAIYRRALGFGDALMSFAELVRHVDTPMAEQVFVAGSVDAATLLDELSPYPGMTVVDRSRYSQVLGAQRNTNDAANVLFLALIIVFCGIAVINTLAMATGDRSREFSLLRLAGATTRQVRSMVRWELALVILLSAVLGIVASWATLTGFSIGVTGQRTPAVEPLAVAEILLGAATLGAMALFLPARILLHRNPADVLASGR